MARHDNAGSARPQQVVERDHHVVDLDCEQSWVRTIREHIAHPHAGVGEHTVRAGRRAPLLRRRRPEEDYRRPPEGAGQVRCAGIGGDHNLRACDGGGELGQRGGSGHDEYLAGASPHRLSYLPRALRFYPVTGEQDAESAVQQMLDHSGESVDRPVPARVGGADVDHRGARAAAESPRIDSRSGQPVVEGGSGHVVRMQQTHPPLALVDLFDPLGSVPSLGGVPDTPAGLQVFQQSSALNTVAVQVDGNVDDSRSNLQRVVQGVRSGQQFVDSAGQLDQRPQPRGARQHDPVLRKTGAQSPQRGHRHQQISEFERTQCQHCGLVHAVSLPQAILFDRDNTLVVDVPYNGDPELVELMPGAALAVEMARAHEVPVGVVSNQSGIGRGLITEAQVDAVNHRVDELLGPFDLWEICSHTAADGCSCRKPAPGMLHSAAVRLGVELTSVVFIGDIGADMGAAEAAGCRGILVPTPITRAEEVEAADEVAADLPSAVADALGVLADSPDTVAGGATR